MRCARSASVSCSSTNALGQIDAWLESLSLSLLAEVIDYWEHLRRQVARSKIRGPKVNDARVAAIRFSHGVPELRTRNPLIG